MGDTRAKLIRTAAELFAAKGFTSTSVKDVLLAAGAGAIEECFHEAADRFPEGTDFRRLARFVLVTMEGGVMLSRTYRSLAPFDDAVAELRQHVDRLLAGRRHCESGARNDRT